MQWIFRVMFLPGWLVGIAAWFVCLAFSVTWRWRFGATGLAVVLSLALLVPCFGLPRSRQRRMILLGLVLVGMGFMAPLPLLAPGKAGQGELVTAQHVVRDNKFKSWEFGLVNLIPEVDQFAMVILLAWMKDPLVNQSKAARLRRLAVEVYEEKDSDPALGNAGSALQYTYDELLGRPSTGDHYLAMVPRMSKGQRIPLVVFLHGFGGNFAGYWKVLIPLVRQHGMAVICPTFGIGQYSRETNKALLRMIEDVRRRYPAISGKPYLVGLSNGAMGVILAVQARQGSFAGVGFISGSIYKGDNATKDAWRGLPVLSVHGARDLRIPPATILPALVWMNEVAGARLTKIEFDEEDHYLVLSRRKEVVRHLVGWMANRE